MKHTIDAIYEKGIFRPIRREAISIVEGHQVRITVEDEVEPDALRLAMAVYDGLTDKEIGEIEQIALARSKLFRNRSSD